MRVGCWLKANKVTESPHSLIFLDSETIQRTISPKKVSHHLWFAWACHQRTTRAGKWSEPVWARFTRHESFWEWVESIARSKTRVWLVCHNAGFDLRVMRAFDLLPRREWELQRAIIEDPPTILSWRRGTSTLTAIDTMNWFRLPLAKIGEHLGLDKLPMPSRRASITTWDTYCKRDVEITRRAMIEWITFLQDHDLGGFAPTLASQSLRAYRHRFMTHPILIDTDTRALRLARASYHGGRTECFRLGRVPGPVRVYDVTSQYPAVMRDHLYPSVLKAFHLRASKRDLRRWLKRYCLVAKCHIETDEPAYAHHHNDRLCFPVGRFVAHLTTPDLSYALEHGHIHKVINCAVYDAQPIFVKWVNEIFALRAKAKQEGNDVYVWLLKILMNSLYGKFGQRGNVWQEVERTDDMTPEIWIEYDAVEGITRKLRRFAGLVQEWQTSVECATSHPAIASHVTAYARRLLWRMIQDAGHDRVVYCDTDSLCVVGRLSSRLRKWIHPTKLGRLKLEKTHAWMLLYGLKDYASPGHAKRKGIRLNARRLGYATWSQEQWSSLKSVLRSDSTRVPTTETRTKTLRRVYTKGTRLPSGRVSPLCLREW